MPSATRQNVNQNQATLPEPSLSAGGPIPRDARLMALILASMGLTDVQPQVLLQLLEFSHRYTYDVLSDALIYADHASTRQGTTSVTLDDVTLAIQSRVGYSFTSSPSKDMLLSLASSLNSVPLPPISDRHGVRLPPPQHCLTNVNFSIVPNPPPPDYGDDPSDEEQGKTAGDETSKVDREEDGDKTEIGAGSGLEGGKGRIGEEDIDDVDFDGEVDDEAAVAGPVESKESLDGGQGEGKVGETGGEGEGGASRGLKRSLDEDEDYD
ncbi:TFIID-31kDa-domain-containing protein [Violaceomyces palustris]|uniref:TFIID-31kDa-domain-containing protein n=1 Tax=Violaceomyces palustris TaxID=1673888 RepID=A0ACD0P1G7_9BASI|nr:TFIID-31kDa-domain-containing protein [Violaceomyces palustris]